MPDTLDPRYSGLARYSNITPTVMFIYDTTDGVSGSYRAARQSDLGTVATISGNVSIDDNITLSGDSRVGVTGGYIGITGTPTVNLSAGTVIGLTGTTSVNINAGQQVGVTGSPTITSLFLSSTATSNSTVSGTNGMAIPANSSRTGWFIQNLATSQLYVRFSASLADSGNFNLVLKGGTTERDGNGGSFTDDKPKYKGAVSVSGASSPLWIAWEL